jgi:hypothetical protein
MTTVRGWRGREIAVTVRHGGDDAVAVLLPGAGYTPAHPLLHFTGSLLQQAGWSVLELWWGDTLAGWDNAAEPDLFTWLGEDTLAAVEAAGQYGRVAGFVTKSLGTLGLSAAADRRPELAELPAIWLTPLLRRPAVVQALASWRAPALAVIAERDPVPEGVDLRRLGAHVRTVVTSGTDHALETDDPVGSVDVLRDVLVETHGFVGDLGSG